jgi:hypothetical protein
MMVLGCAAGGRARCEAGSERMAGVARWIQAGLLRAALHDQRHPLGRQALRLYPLKAIQRAEDRPRADARRIQPGFDHTHRTRLL